jgi:hypothetical protein
MRHDIGKRIVVTLRSADIAAFIKERQAEGAGGNTIRHDLNMLSRLFNVAASTWGFESLRTPVPTSCAPRFPRAGRAESTAPPSGARC